MSAPAKVSPRTEQACIDPSIHLHMFNLRTGSGVQRNKLLYPYKGTNGTVLRLGEFTPTLDLVRCCLETFGPVSPFRLILCFVPSRRHTPAGLPREHRVGAYPGPTVCCFFALWVIITQVTQAGNPGHIHMVLCKCSVRSLPTILLRRPRCVRHLELDVCATSKTGAKVRHCPSAQCCRH
ncbi:hypothetical protein N658DRAFT_34783 [Parathielavia hyrcaniae]|uniref:Uncharacterized protein n=1 Tax=Parathielavia hyrcaniae TaxID=113614 RepID=A0AAN6QGF0_9PEZI|nr:hypothetical protein N658DRAFT_34783 [Parathielavia hyrcaniae]